MKRYAGGWRLDEDGCFPRYLEPIFVHNGEGERDICNAIIQISP